MQEIAIISAPHIREDQVKNLIYAIEAEGNLPFPVYVTKARLTPVSKEDVLEWFETLVKIGVDMGWSKDISNRLKDMKPNE